MNPILSLVTGKVERDDSFNRLVDSIIQNTSLDWELVVADASEKQYQTKNPRIRVMHEKPRLTHSKGYNRAFRECRGTWCLWLNDDAEVCPDYDTEAVSFMKEHPQIGLGALHYSENGGPFHVNQAWQVPYANFGIFRRELGEMVGFFDHEVSMYGADNTLALRILLANYGVSDIPKARIIHHSEKDQIRADNQKLRRLDNQKLTEKYMPYRRQWQAAYLRHRVETGTVYWSHGVEPRMVTA